MRQCGFEHGYGGGGVGDFDDELAVVVVAELDDDGVVGVVDVPEDALIVLIERAGGNDSGDVRALHAYSVIPGVGDGGVGTDAGDVLQRNFEGTLQGPELVGSADVEDEFTVGDRKIDHAETVAQIGGTGQRGGRGRNACPTLITKPGNRVSAPKGALILADYRHR